MQKIKKDIITLLLFVGSFILFSISLQSYWYKIKFSDNEIYYFRYTNIEIENYIIGNQSSSTDVPQPTSMIMKLSTTSLSSPSHLLSFRYPYGRKSNDSLSTIIKEIGYGEAHDTQEVFLTCLTCAIISLCSNFIILILQLINLKIETKHNAFLMCILSKVVGFICLAFNISSVLYLLSFRQYFDKDCKILGNCLDLDNNKNNNNSSSDSSIDGGGGGGGGGKGGSSIDDSINYTAKSAIEFIGSTDTTYYRPHLGWLLNAIAFFFIVAGISFLFVPKDKKKKINKYQLLV